MIRMLSIAGVFLLAPMAQADVLNVGGPNPDYATIASATEMALDGDVVRVWPGASPYGSFSVNGKSLSIVPEQSSSSILVQGVIRVVNLSASQSVELVGVREPAGLGVLKFIGNNNLGAVRVTGSRFVWRGTTASGFDQVVDVLGCANLTFVDCVIDGQDGLTVYSGQAGPADHGARIINSDVAFYGCSISGGNGGDVILQGLPFSTDLGGDGGDALRLHGAGSVFLSNSAVTGGLGGTGYSWGNLVLAEHGDSIRTLNANYAITYINTNLVGYGSNPTGLNVTLPSTVRPMGGNGLVLRGSTWIYDTDVIDVEVTGDVGARVGLYLSTGYGSNFAAIGGPLLVHIPGGSPYLRWMYLGRISPSGTLQASIPMRDLPLFAHVRLHMTAMSITPTGRMNSNSFSPLVFDTAW